MRRIETAYDSQGNAYLFTSYDAASGGSVVNQVEDLFNGLGQLTTQYQAHAGAVLARRGRARVRSGCSAAPQASTAKERSCTVRSAVIPIPG